MLEPFDKGLLATTLRYPYEVRDHAEYFEDIPDLKLPDEMKKLAAHIVETKAGHFEPKTFEDHYEKALVELLKNKQAGRPIETVGEEKAAAAGDQPDGRPAGEHRCRHQEAGGRQHRRPPPAASQEEGRRDARFARDGLPLCSPPQGERRARGFGEP